MRSLISRLTIAVVLFAISGVFIAESRRLDRSADTRQRFATLRYDAGAAAEATDLLSSMLPETGFGSERSVVVDQATATYWQARYDDLVAAREAIDRDPDPELLLLAANAAFRASQQKVQTRQDQARDLELVLQAYATVLKANAFVPDAAYNYEYVVRLRDSLARPRAGAPAEVKPTDAQVRTELPPGPTIHGRPGGPPPRVKGEEFEIIAPMEFGDRETQPEPTGGARPLRKG